MFIPKVRNEVTGKDGEAIKIEEQAREAKEIVTSAITRLAAGSRPAEDIEPVDPETTH